MHIIIIFNQIIAIYFFSIFFFTTKVASQQIDHSQEMALGHKNTNYFYVSILALSSKFIHLEISTPMYRRVQNWFCPSLGYMSSFPWVNDKNYLVLSPGDFVNKNEGKECFWIRFDEMYTVCWNKTANPIMKQEDLYTDLYEPQRNLSTELLINSINLLENECSLEFNSSIKFKIILFTNFAEKKLVDFLQINKKFRTIEQIQLCALNVPSANYYFYSMNDTSNLKYYSAQMGELILKKNWHQIYLFALSKNLTQKQLVNIVNAAKTPMTLYFMQNEPKPRDNNEMEQISVMLVSNIQYSRGVDFVFCETQGLYIDNCYQYIQLSNDLTFDSFLIEEEYKNVTELYNKSILNYEFQNFGAQLPSEQISDAVKPPFQPKPRIVLITDFVETEFLNKTLPQIDRNRFEFKVYSLHPEVYKQFKGKADSVICVNPDNPDPVIKNCWIILSLVVAVICMAILLTLFTIIYRRRLHKVNWLHRLEQFKTEHLYAAYLNSEKKNSCKNGPVDNWEMGWDQIILTNELLGKGAFGEVRKAKILRPNSEHNLAENLFKLRKEKQQVAVKMLPIHAAEKGRKIFKHEIKMMKLIGNGHQCIVQMIGCMSREGGMLGLVLEYCSGGSMLDWVLKMGNGKSGEEMGKFMRKIPKWAWQISDGMAFLGTKNLVHRDLAARNVLLDGNLVAKICDFGLCIFADEFQPNLAKSEIQKAKENGEITEEKEKLPIRLLAPECLEKKIFTQKSDIWSFGLLLYEIYSFGRNPFDGIEHKELLRHIRENRPQKPENCPNKIYDDFMELCFRLKPRERPNFVEIKEKLTKIIDETLGEYGYLALE